MFISKNFQKIGLKDYKKYCLLDYFFIKRDLHLLVNSLKEVGE